jgi:hypothetical protein
MVVARRMKARRSGFLPLLPPLLLLVQVEGLFFSGEDRSGPIEQRNK